MNHIKNANLNEKKLNLNNTAKADEPKEKEISQKDIDKAVKVQQELLSVLTNNRCTVNESYMILASMLESIYAYSILKDFGYKEK